MDLSKSFDTLIHAVLIANLKSVQSGLEGFNYFLL